MKEALLKLNRELTSLYRDILGYELKYSEKLKSLNTILDYSRLCDKNIRAISELESYIFYSLENERLYFIEINGVDNSFFHIFPIAENYIGVLTYGDSLTLSKCYIYKSIEKFISDLKRTLNS